MSVAVASLMPFALAIVAPTFSTRLKGRGTPHIQTWILAAIVASIFGVFLSYLPFTREGGVVIESIEWVPQLGMSLTLYLDSLSLIFALLVTGVGVIIIIFAGYYFDTAEEVGKFYGLMLGFMGAMLGLVLSGNILTLFIAWELTSIISFMLISFKSKYEEARFGALQALMITAGGGLALLAGLLLLGAAGGSYDFQEILTDTSLRDHPFYAAFTILILAGCFSKSAQFPLHFWLPGAMTAPTPASSYLHSATMVKAGIYLLLRFSPVLGDTPLWTTAITVVGFGTMLFAAIISLTKNDLKAILAYSTVSKLGAIVGLIGLPESAGIKAALVAIIAHALYKATLFMVAGSIDHATGTRDWPRFGGLYKTFPWLAGLTVIAGLSMAGAPFIGFMGFVAKETLLDAVLNGKIIDWLSTSVVVLASGFTVAVAFVLIYDVFFGEPRDTDLHPHRLPAPIAVGPAMLSVGTVVFAIFLEPVIGQLIEGAVPKEFKLHFIPVAETLPAFGLSLLAIVIGSVVFATRSRWREWYVPLPAATNIYQSTVRTVEWFGDLLLQSQMGKLRYYLAVILGSFAALMGIASAIRFTDVESFSTASLELAGGAGIAEMVFLFIAITGALGTILFRRHLLAALSLGVMGYAVGGVFLLEPAPDVALVHFLVETLATVLIIIMLGRISSPQRSKAMNRLWGQTRGGLIRDISISAVIGIVVAIFAIAAVVNRPERGSVAEFHLQDTNPTLGVTDVVAAILADYRGTDTLIEITVFAMAAIGVLTVLSSFRPDAPISPGRRNPLAVIPMRKQAQQQDGDQRQSSQNIAFSTPLTRTVARFTLPFALLISLVHVLYGGFAPGDGFTAGVVAGLGLAIWYVVFGYEGARSRLSWLSPGRLIAFGLFLAVFNALVPMLIGLPFFGHISVDATLPAGIKLASSTIFEIAIFLTVFGSVGTIMEAIAYPWEVERL